MEDKLYEKIGRQEVVIETFAQAKIAELSSLIAKFMTGEEKPEDWSSHAKRPASKESHPGRNQNRQKKLRRKSN